MWRWGWEFGEREVAVGAEGKEAGWRWVVFAFSLSSSGCFVCSATACCRNTPSKILVCCSVLQCVAVLAWLLLQCVAVLAWL